MPTLDWLTRREDEQTASKASVLEHDADAGLLTLENLSHVLARAGENHA